MLVKESATFYRSQKQGSIIFISSLAAVYSSPYSYAPYEISKSALIKLSQTIARENAQFQIRCNSILPGMIEIFLGCLLLKQFINKIFIEKNIR